MNKFIQKYILQPLAARWMRGLFLLLIWTVAFITLPSISGWFLAMCSVAFVTSNTLFAYLIPSAIIRFLAIIRTVTRYFERLENHKSTLEAQQNLQLKIFQSVAKFPYFKKQINNNSALLENSTYGVDQILNHILLWILPFTTLLLSLAIYFGILTFFSPTIAIEYLVLSLVLLFALPQFIFRKNRVLYEKLKTQREENNQALVESFRGRIEISKYNLEEKAIEQGEQRLTEIELLESKLQENSFWLQLIVGLGFGFIAALLLWNSSNYNISAPVAIGIFFGIMAQAELSEMLFSGKSEKSSVAHQVNDIRKIFDDADQIVDLQKEELPTLEKLIIENLSATIPETPVCTNEVSLELMKGEWMALFGETGKGKTTLLNSFFYPEYQRGGSLIWNDSKNLSHLPIPECIYVTQKAYLLTGTLRENFEGNTDDMIEEAIKTVDLSSWYSALPNGLDSWLGENGETLSGGQRKKLLLAQALLKKPQLLVIDEPTAGISSENAIAIFKNIRQMYPDMTILMATHLPEFENLVDKVVRL